MNKIELSCINEIDDIKNKIYQVEQIILSVNKKIIRDDEIPYINFEIFFENIRKILYFWTNYTYVGYEKDVRIQKAYQRFYKALYDFICICKKSTFKNLQDFAQNALYQGKLYRYIGYNSNYHNPEIYDFTKEKQPIYNEIYVSWSKNERNYYIESKLCGTITVINCNVIEPYYGIDLEVFDVVKGDEAEVIFPTIKDLIIDIKYIHKF